MGNRGEGFLIVQAIDLCKALGNQSSLVSIRLSCCIEFESIDPFASNCLATRRQVHYFPSPIVLERFHFLFHSFLPLERGRDSHRFSIGRQFLRQQNSSQESCVDISFIIQSIRTNIVSISSGLSSSSVRGRARREIQRWNSSLLTSASTGRSSGDNSFWLWCEWRMDWSGSDRRSCRRSSMRG